MLINCKYMLIQNGDKWCTKCVRSSDHYVNNTSGETTSVWFDRRRRIPHPLGGLEGANWSANVREILKCPATPQSISKSSKSARNATLTVDTRFFVWEGLPILESILRNCNAASMELTRIFVVLCCRVTHRLTKLRKVKMYWMKLRSVICWVSPSVSGSDHGKARSQQLLQERQLQIYLILPHFG